MGMPDRQEHNSASTVVEPEKAGSWKKTSSEFVHKLSTFFKETWRSILVLCIMGAVTGGVSSQAPINKDKTDQVAGLERKERVQPTLSNHLLRELWRHCLDTIRLPV